MNNYSLRLFTPWHSSHTRASLATITEGVAEYEYIEPTTDYNYVYNFTNEASRVVVENNSAGPLQMTFELTGDAAKTWFNTYMAYTVELGNVRVSWRGIVWDMTGTIDGLKVSRSLEDTYNAVRTVYKDADVTVEEGLGRTDNITDWVEDLPSIEMYGRRELVLQPGLEMSADYALAWTVSNIIRTSKPYTQVEGTDFGAENKLNVIVVGMQVAANNMYVQPNDYESLTPIGIGERMAQLAPMLLPWLNVGEIQDGETAVFMRSAEGLEEYDPDKSERLPDYGARYSDDQRLWTHLTRLAKGASLQKPWLVDSWGGVFTFRPFPIEPTMVWTSTGLTAPNGGAISWRTQPGVFRNKTVRSTGMRTVSDLPDVTTKDFTGWLLSNQDTFINGFSLELETGEVKSIEPGIYTQREALDSYYDNVYPTITGGG